MHIFLLNWPYDDIYLDLKWRLTLFLLHKLTLNPEKGSGSVVEC